VAVHRAGVFLADDTDLPTSPQLGESAAAQQHLTGSFGSCVSCQESLPLQLHDLRWWLFPSAGVQRCMATVRGRQ
jgi:hypothetical protein